MRSSIEAAQRIAKESLDASTDIARTVQASLKTALDALTDADKDKGSRPTRR